MENPIHASEQISLFCRMHLNTKKDLPIRSSEMGMLIYLVKTKGTPTPQGVAQFFNVTKAMATNMVSSMLAKGYIEKEQSTTDKRRFLIKPTEKALQLVEEAYDEYFKMLKVLETKLGLKKFDQLVALLEEANEILLEEKKNG